MPSCTLRPFTLGILLSSLCVGLAPAASQPLDVDTKMRAFTQRASQDELDAFARRKRMSPAGRQADTEYQARQRAEAQQIPPTPPQESARRESIRAIRDSLEGRPSQTSPTLPASRTKTGELMTVVLDFCTAVGNTAAQVAEARNMGMTPATTIQFFRVVAKEEAESLITHIVIKTLFLMHDSSPTKVRDAITTHCLNDPTFWQEPESLRY